MEKTKKDIIQEKIKEDIIKNNFKGIILASVRTGKTRILLNSIKEHSKNHIENPKILVLYPNIDIKNSWKKECDLIDFLLIDVLRLHIYKQKLNLLLFQSKQMCNM